MDEPLGPLEPVRAQLESVKLRGEHQAKFPFAAAAATRVQKCPAALLALFLLFTFVTCVGGTEPHASWRSGECVVQGCGPAAHPDSSFTEFRFPSVISPDYAAVATCSACGWDAPDLVETPTLSGGSFRTEYGGASFQISESCFPSRCRRLCCCHLLCGWDASWPKLKDMPTELGDPLCTFWDPPSLFPYMLTYAVYAHGASYFADVLRASCPSGYYPRDGSTLEAFQAAADGSTLEAFQAAASEDALAAQAQYYASLGIASSLFTAQATDTQCATLSCCCSDGLSTCFYPLGHCYPLDGFVLEAFQVAIVEHGLAATAVQAAATVDDFLALEVTIFAISAFAFALVWLYVCKIFRVRGLLTSTCCSDFRERGHSTSANPAVFMAPAGSRAYQSIRYLVDTGASQHMGPPEFAVPGPLTLLKSVVKVFGGGNIPITGVGRAEVRVAGGLLPCDDYLICPDAQQFLLSVAKICDLDLNVLFTKLGGRIVSTDGAVFATLTRMGNLYSLDTVVTGFPDDVPCATALPYEIAASLSYAGVDMATWHSRFCHINTPVIIFVLNHNLCDGFKLCP